ncbi:unnamed protein product, partial [Nippostrongylus brasiliensis]|uniref:SCP domain-containing protein n=1 Tax=Nippostrongylus brasiliensis TaxID=27835 RepID=A0A0N4YSA6_NIPBR
KIERTENSSDYEAPYCSNDNYTAHISSDNYDNHNNYNNYDYSKHYNNYDYSTTTTTTPSTTTTTTTRRTTTSPAQPVTREIARKITDRHNHYRSMVARGMVRCGKPGNKNCPPATNMQKLHYDWAVGIEAQWCADGCPTSQAAKCNNPRLGTNVYIADSNTVPFEKAFESAVDTWFNEILINGMNYQMLFTKMLMTKYLGPTRFTQVSNRANLFLNFP